MTKDINSLHKFEPMITLTQQKAKSAVHFLAIAILMAPRLATVSAWHKMALKILWARGPLHLAFRLQNQRSLSGRLPGCTEQT